MENIKSKLTNDLAKKLLSNRKNAEIYLCRYNEIKTIPQLSFRKITREKNKGKKVLDVNTKKIWELVVNTWDYKVSRKIIRDIFKETEKYKNGKEADNAMNILIKEWLRYLKVPGVRFCSFLNIQMYLGSVIQITNFW